MQAETKPRKISQNEITQVPKADGSRSDWDIVQEEDALDSLSEDDRQTYVCLLLRVSIPTEI